MKIKHFFSLLFTLLIHLSLAQDPPPSYFETGWNEIEMSQSEQPIKVLNYYLDFYQFERPEVTSVRVKSLSFYKEANLYEYLGSNKDTLRRYYILAINGGSKYLNGYSSPIFEVNKENELLLDSDEQITDYLKFFINTLNADEGRFHLISRKDEYRYLFHSDASFNSIKDKINEPRVVERAGTYTRVSGSMLYGNVLFDIKLKLNADGSVDMEDDNPLAKDLPMIISRFASGGVQAEKTLAYLNEELKENQRQQTATENRIDSLSSNIETMDQQLDRLNSEMSELQVAQQAAYYGLSGGTFSLSGQYDSALFYYKKSNALYEDLYESDAEKYREEYASSIYSVGSAENNLKNESIASKYFSEVIALLKEQSLSESELETLIGAYYRKGRIIEKTDSEKAVTEYYTKLIDLNPCEPLITWVALVRRANYYKNQEQYQLALNDINRSIDCRGEKNLLLIRLRSQLNEDLKNYDDAATDYLTIIEDSPGDKENIRIATAVSRWREFDGVPFYTSLIEIDPDNRAYYYQLRGLAHYKNRNKEAACEDIQKTKAIRGSSESIERIIVRVCGE